VECHLAFEDVEAFILAVMDVPRALVALGSEYLHQSVAPAGLLTGSLYGSQLSKLPPRLAVAWVLCEGPARRLCFCIAQDLAGSLPLDRCHIACLLSVHISVP
jgi:hypothetical protein